MAKDQKKGFGINAIFRYPKVRGFGNIAYALSRNCKGQILCDMDVTEIDTENKLIEFNGNKQVPYKSQIISTIPLTKLLLLIKEPLGVVRVCKQLVLLLV